MNNQII